MLVWSILLWVVLFGFYLLLAGQADAVEVTAAIVCASLGTGHGFGLYRVAHRHFRLAPPMHALRKPLAALLPDTLSVGIEMIRVILEGARGQRGAFVRQPFDPGSTDSQSSGRRATAVLGLSLTPRGFVIRGEQSDIIILHAMPPKPASKDVRWPA